MFFSIVGFSLSFLPSSLFKFLEGLDSADYGLNELLLADLNAYL